MRNRCPLASFVAIQAEAISGASAEEQPSPRMIRRDMDIIIRVEPRCFEIQTLEYPAPVCSRCGRLMFVTKRVSVSTEHPRTAVRVAYRCTGCSIQTTRRGQTPKAVPDGEFY
jgi:hypothetical protein